MCVWYQYLEVKGQNTGLSVSLSIIVAPSEAPLFPSGHQCGSMQAPPLRPFQVHHHQYHVLIKSVIPYCSGRSSGLWEVRDSGFLSQHRLSVTSPLGSCSRLSFRGSRSPSRLLPFLRVQMCLPRRWQDPLEPLFRWMDVWVQEARKVWEWGNSGEQQLCSGWGRDWTGVLQMPPSFPQEAWTWDVLKQLF